MSLNNGTTVARYVHAGDPDDCGHERPGRKGGKFAPGNDCAGGEGGTSGSPTPSPQARPATEAAPRPSFKKGRPHQVNLPPAYRGKVTDRDLNQIESDKSWDEFISLAHESVSNHSGGRLPTVNELIVLARIGESTRGQYELGRKLIEASIGKSMAHTWGAVNAILSSQTEYREHTIGALRFLRMWVERGKPTDKESADKLINDFEEFTVSPMRGGVRKDVDCTGVRSPTTPAGQEKMPARNPDGTVNKDCVKAYAFMDKHKRRKLSELIQAGGKPTREMIAEGGTGKTAEFSEAWWDKSATAIDKWMSEITVPDKIFPEGAAKFTKELVRLNMLQAKAQLKNLSKKQVEAGKEDLNKDSKKLLDDINKYRHSIINNGQTYAAYKVAVSTAAEQMGWEPREVQEAVWSSVIAISLLKVHGLEDQDIIKNLVHEMVSQNWDIRGIFNDPEVQKLVAGKGVPKRIATVLANSPRPGFTGKVKISEQEEAALREAIPKIGIAGPRTRIGKSVYLPKAGGGVEQIPRWRSIKSVSRFVSNMSRRGFNGREIWSMIKSISSKPVHDQEREIKRYQLKSRTISRFAPLEIPSCKDSDETTHGFDHSRIKNLSGSQVAEIIANQYKRRRSRRPRDRSPRNMQHQWVASTLFRLRSIPSWVANPPARIEDNDPSYTTGPLIVDLNKNMKVPNLVELNGSFGSLPEIIILDGKHRHRQLIKDGEDFMVDAFVGDEVNRLIDDRIENFGPARSEFIESLNEFYEDPSRMTLARLIKACSEVNLGRRQVRILLANWRVGRHFSPAIGEFVKSSKSRKRFA